MVIFFYRVLNFFNSGPTNRRMGTSRISDQDPDSHESVDPDPRGQK
jgi:hypothetical protein